MLGSSHNLFEYYGCHGGAFYYNTCSRRQAPSMMEIDCSHFKAYDFYVSPLPVVLKLLIIRDIQHLIAILLKLDVDYL